MPTCTCGMPCSFVAVLTSVADCVKGPPDRPWDYHRLAYERARWRHYSDGAQCQLGTASTSSTTTVFGRPPHRGRRREIDAWIAGLDAGSSRYEGDPVGVRRRALRCWC